MSSNTLQIGQSSSGNAATFIQNGQVDWVAFGNTLWSTSAAVLQRFASAGVQPATYGAGLALASQLQLDRVGNQRMHNALDNLSGISGFDKLLWFGFGVRSFVRVMGDTQLGVNCIALCSTLAELHGEDASAWILEELWKAHSYPQQYLPSHAQFTALVKACSGVLAKTSFSSTANRMLAHDLDPRRLTIFPYISNVEDIAKAMQALFNISRGAVSRISITGSLECAFIAALARWLFNFKIYVEDEAGRVVYEDASPEEAQVVVTYSGEAELSLLQVSSTTYVLRGMDDLFNRNPKLDQILLTFRTPWDRCLARVFGVPFDDLISLPHILGGFLGSAASVYRALALGESNVADFSRKTYVNFNEASYGLGFVHAAVSIFPELNGCTGLFAAMQKATDASMEEALRTIEQTIHNLAQSCKCSSCTHDEARIPGKEGYCLLIMAFSIRALISTISCTVRDPELLPTNMGIHFTYTHIHVEWLRQRQGAVPLLSVALGLKKGAMYGEDDIYRKADILSNPIEIFSGYSDRSRYYRESDVLEKDIRTAHARQGVCYYLECLQSVTSQAEMMRMVHILPGYIHMGDRRFSSIYDHAKTSHPSTTAQWNVVQEHDSTAMVEERRYGNIKVEAFGLEKSVEHELVVFYQVSIPGEIIFQLRPGRLTYEILKGTGLVTCDQIHCDRRLAFPCRLVQRGWQAADFNRTRTGIESEYQCFIWPWTRDLARCVLVELTSVEVTYELILRRRECVSCCTASIVRQPARTGYYHIL